MSNALGGMWNKPWGRKTHYVRPSHEAMNNQSKQHVFIQEIWQRTLGIWVERRMKKIFIEHLSHV